MTENREYTEIINIIENKRWDKLKYSLADMHACGNSRYNSHTRQR